MTDVPDLDTSPPLQAIISRSTDPYVNLAIEDRLLETIVPGRRVLYLYRNRDSVVIGRHQNPWIECDLKEMNRDGVLLARRQSGGGAVFHDTGNTNYSLLSTKEEYDQEAGFAIVLHALRSLGLDVEKNDRNDLVHHGKKFSGSAFRHRRGRSFQHGTLLISANLDRLLQYLTPPGRSIIAKGTASVRSKVVNLSSLGSSLDHDRVCDAIVAQFGRRYGNRVSAASLPAIEYVHTEEEVAEVGQATDSRFLASWDWLYGKTPDFEHQLSIALPEGSVLCTLRIHRGQVADASLTGTEHRVATVEADGDVPPHGATRSAADTEGADTAAVLPPPLDPERPLRDVVHALVGCRYTAADLCDALESVSPRQTAALLCKILGKEIP